MLLRAPAREDCQKVRLWRNEQLQALRTPYQLTEEMQDDFYENVICNRNSPHRYWSIFSEEDVFVEFGGTAKDDVFVAFGGITSIQWENSIGEISLIVNQAQIGQGIGEKAVELLLEQAFKHLGLKTVCGECYFCNERGVKFWKEITKKYKGYTTTLPARKFWKGVYFSSMYFSIEQENFLNA